LVYNRKEKKRKNLHSSNNLLKRILRFFLHGSTTCTWTFTTGHEHRDMITIQQDLIEFRNSTAAIGHGFELGHLKAIFRMTSVDSWLLTSSKTILT
jgi:hypothetical protein